MPILLHDASVIAAPSGTCDSSLFSVTSRFRPLAEIDKSLAKAAGPDPNSRKLRRIALRIPITNEIASPAIAKKENSGQSLNRSDPQGIELKPNRQWKETAPAMISSDNWCQEMIVNEAS